MSYPMSGFIAGTCRKQVTLFPDRLDDYITEENNIQVIDAFVDGLDLAKLGFKTVPAKTGRPAYHPSTMLKLFMYGYLNRIQSSRRLEREAGRNIELMWLLERLAPDFKTIADFRKNNSKGIKNTCSSFIGLCREMKMFTDVIVAIDGSKFKAVNSKENNYTPKKLQFHIARFEKHMEKYMAQLDKSDQEDNAVIDEAPVKDRIVWLKKRLAELRALEEEVTNQPEQQLSTTDPDSRLMKTQGMTRIVCFNVQSAVDTKSHLIAGHDVTNKQDRGQLCAMGKLVQTALGKESITVIADKGYYSRSDIKDTQDAGMVAVVAKGDTSGSEKKGIFNRSEFRYDSGKDIYICPANKKLTYRFSGVEKGLTIRRYFLDTMTCRACHLKSQCSKGKGPRKISRWEHQDEIDPMDDLVTSSPDMMLLRKQTVEHPFGTIKAWMGATHFLTRGLENVRTEMNLHVLAYNLKRMISIHGPEKLIAAMAV
jgi:transposase|tara:strand:- start:185 stop:1627 length:1443 start_codon:yes stop_codon:yes gene_type:complete